MIFFSTLFMAFFITLVLIPPLRDHADRLRAVDIPNARKVHAAPIPKIGGLAMALGTLLPIMLWTNYDPFVLAVLAGSALIVTCGFIDDILTLGYGPKFLAQTAGAGIVVLGGGVKISLLGLLNSGTWLTLPDIVAIPLTILLIVGATNAINLSDGLDGLAGGISLLGFLGIACLAFLCQDEITAVFALAAAGAIFGFLIYNTYPASVFMGDAGSQLLGFLAIILAINLTQRHSALNPAIPVLLLGFPILDTAVVMVERILKGKSPFQADKNHFHHKLMRLGLNQKDSVLCIYVIQSVLLVLTLIFRYHTMGFLLIPYLLIALTIITGFILTERRIRRKAFSGSPSSRFIPAFVNRQTIIRSSFAIIEIGLPALFITSALIATPVPPYAVVLALGAILLIIATWRIKQKALKQVLRLSLYLTIPVVAHLGQPRIAHWNTLAASAYTFSFVAVFFFVIVTLKYTRRRQGFRSTPMDYLILFIALILPTLFKELHLTEQTGVLTIKILILFFGFEILIGELRERYLWLAFSTLATLLLVGVRGLL